MTYCRPISDRNISHYKVKDNLCGYAVSAFIKCDIQCPGLVDLVSCKVDEAAYCSGMYIILI